jgi:hypothetical protein
MPLATKLAMGDDIFEKSVAATAAKEIWGGNQHASRCDPIALGRDRNSHPFVLAPPESAVTSDFATRFATQSTTSRAAVSSSAATALAACPTTVARYGAALAVPEWAARLRCGSEIDFVVSGAAR